MFKHFRNGELGVIALEEEDDNWISQQHVRERKESGGHNARESRTVDGEFYTLFFGLVSRCGKGVRL